MSNTITIVRTGKRPAVVEDVNTAREAFDKLGISSDLFDRWAITNAMTGDLVYLDDEVGNTTLICGDRVEGATS